MSLFSPNKEFDRARSEANAQVIVELSDFMMKNPSMRFNQILLYFGIDPNNQASEEPQVTLTRIKSKNP